MLKLINELIQFIKSLFKKKTLLGKLKKHYHNTYFKDPKTGSDLRLIFAPRSPQYIDFEDTVEVFVEDVKLMSTRLSEVAVAMDFGGEEPSIAYKYPDTRCDFKLFSIDTKSNTLEQVVPLIDKYILRFKGLLNE